MRSLMLIGLWPFRCVAAPTEHDGLQYHNFEARQQNLPTLKLPYGTWQASKYDQVGDYYYFNNIRFAAPPVGNLRFMKPASPAVNTTLQDGRYGPTCPQTIPKALIQGQLPGGSTGVLGSFIGGIDFSKLIGGSMGEDCLFLDLIVPAKALRGEVKLPIINWIYGGAYILGAKDQLDGGALVRNAGGNVIFIAGNYRLGSFGFMAGTTLEKEATPNAGLWDQRAVQQWIQDHASLFGGDSNDVSLWGESAGGGSIMHHLTAFGGKEKVMFKKANIQSPAYDVLLDRRVQSEKLYTDFSAAAGCSGKGMACLRALSYTELKAIQDKFIDNLPAGKFGFGPATDGTFVRQLPALEFASGNFVKGLDTLIISHVANEAAIFVQNNINNDSEYQQFQTLNFGTTPQKLPEINKAMIEKLPSPSNSSKYRTMKDRVLDYVQFSVFTCNVRWITEAYANKTYNVQYSRSSGYHGTDLLATFFQAGTGLGYIATLSDRAGAFAPFATQYQTYFTSHTRSGDPNKYKVAGAIEWPIARVGPSLGMVLNAGDKGFELIEDPKTRAEDCDFWRDAYAALTAAGGYAPPDAVVKSKLFNIEGNPSANYQ